MQCPYCLEKAEYVSGEEIYPWNEKMHKRHFWLCRPCDAYIGADKDGRGFGTLADFETREARHRAAERVSWLVRETGLRRMDVMRLVFEELDKPIMPLSRMDKEQAEEFERAVRNVLDNSREV